MSTSIHSVDELRPVVETPNWGINAVQERVDQMIYLIKTGAIGGGDSGEAAPLSPVVPVEKDDYDAGRNVTYDLTKVDPKFRRKQQLMVFTPHQLHTFPTPVHLDSIVVKTYVNEQWVTIPREGTVPGSTNVWKINEYAYDTMSSAYRIDSSFTGDIIKSIELDILSDTASTTDRVLTVITAQCAFKPLYELHGFDGVGPSYTPALGRYFLEKLEELTTVMNTNISNTFATTDSVNDMLEEDLTGEKPENYVEFESHHITRIDTDTLMPGRGSCYAHDFQMWQYAVRTGTVQMSNKAYNINNRAIFLYEDVSNVGMTNTKVATTKRVYLDNDNYDQYIGMAGRFIDRARLTPLVKGVDYELVNLNVPKTEMSSSQYGVYDSIRMLKSFTGDILISYHAFGGDVVFQDVKDLRQDIINAMNVLTSKKLLTADVIDKQPVIKDLLSRLQVIEQYHNHFARVEHAVYMNDPGFHWFDIATLYDTAWNDTESVTSEIGTFRVQSKEMGWCYEFIIGVDLKKKLVDVLRCKTLMSTDVNTSDLTGYLKYANNRDDVAVRVCWVNDGKESGIVLQLGWNFDRYQKLKDDEGRVLVNGVSTDTITVTNKSGVTSKWRLTYNPMDNTYESSASPKVYTHMKFVLTSDTQYASGKDYFTYDDVYAYYRTSDERVRDGVPYFTLNSDNKYVSVDLTAGELVSNYVDEVKMSLNGISCKKGVFQRVLVRKVYKKLVPGTDYTVGGTITGSIYQVKDGWFSNDTDVQMPNPLIVWKLNTTGCYHLERILEPLDGLVAWAGNVPLLATTTDTVTQLGCSINPVTQDNIDLSAVKGVKVHLYDRKLDRVVVRSVDVGYMEPEYEPVQEATAVAGKTYYGRIGNGTDESPYQYFVTHIPATSALDPTRHFVCSNKDRLIGQVIFDLLDLCGSSIEIYKDDNGHIVHDLLSYVGTDSAINQRFDIRQIDYNF